jgi:hypothetical protein
MNKRLPMNEFVTIATPLDPASKHTKYLCKFYLNESAIREASIDAVVVIVSTLRMIVGRIPAGRTSKR